VPGPKNTSSKDASSPNDGVTNDGVTNDGDTIHGVTIRAALLAVLAVAALLVLGWLLQLPDAPPTPNANGSRAVTQEQAQATGSKVPDRAAASKVERQALTANEPQPDQPSEWTVQLVGMRTNVPWSAPLSITFEGRLEVHGAVDADGAFRFVPPPGARNPGMQHLRVSAADPNYRIPHAEHRTAPLQHTGQMTLAVEATAILRGRVVDPDGNGILARMRAFMWDADGPREPLRARTVCDEDGFYQIRVPPAVPLLLVADVTQATFQDRGQSLFAVDNSWPTSSSAMEDLARRDARQSRADLVPASQRVEGEFCMPRDLPDLQLGPTSVVTGRAALANGQPLANVWINAGPAQASKPAWHYLLHWTDRQRIVPGGRTRTNADGTFSLHLATGEQFQFMATAERPLLLAGEPTAVATAPGHVELTAPGELITLQALDQGKPVPRAWIDIDEFRWRTDATGSLQVTLKPGPVRVRSRHNVHASPWIELPATGRPPVVALTLAAQELSDVRIHLQSKPVLLNAMFTWQPLPVGVAFRLATQRNASDEPFVLHIPPGKYELSIHDVHNAQGGVYLLPSNYQVTVPPEGLSATYDATFGGTIEVDVFAPNRTRRGGTFSLTDASGNDVTPMTMAWDGSGAARIAEAGTLQPLSTNRLAAVFPAGSYTLTVRSPTHGTVTRTVIVTKRSRTHVPIEFQ
tara:strand:- start:21040 stop:23115 length:2076 start_codon:yes stop_codon:yes gene_type:complete